MKKGILLFVGSLLLFIGAYALPEEGIPYTKEHKTQFGPFEASARTREKIDMSPWLAWTLVLAGVGMSVSAAYGKHQKGS